MPNYANLKTIYVITQVNALEITEFPNLVRLRNTLRLIPKLEWILVENAFSKSQKIIKFVAATALPKMVHLAKKAPIKSQVSNKSAQYIAAAEWLVSKRADLNLNSVVYFASSTGSYTMKLFDEVSIAEKIILDLQRNIFDE